MNFLVKIENAVNFLLIKLFSLMAKFVPAPVRAFFQKMSAGLGYIKLKVKDLPTILKKLILSLISLVKATLTTVDFKAIFIDSYKNAMAKYKAESEKEAGQLKKFFLAPFLVVGHWLEGLSVGQTLLLLSFSSASILATIGISFSGQRIADKHLEANRAPASVEEVVEYERPGYYKKSSRHFDLTNIRLPVYFPQVNEVKSVDIDFTATVSNRQARMFLEKKEFQLRDHLVIQIEPSIASFPIEEEGKEIIRKKIWNEINDFLKAHNIEGEVTELKITYILAN